MDVLRAGALVGAAVVAGAINSVAGGGTLITFPALIACGLDPIIANATNTTALVPGSLASAFAYREELRRDGPIVKLLLAPAFIGGLLGALLLLFTPTKIFDAIVPLLVLFAAVLLLYQNLKRAPVGGVTDVWTLPTSTRFAIFLELLAGIYGGYFGAGMGIMLLALLIRLGGNNIHRMNAIKTLLAATVNIVACVTFLVAKKIDLPIGLMMAVGAIAGGAGGATLARRANPKIVRWVVVALGLVIAALLAWRRYAPR